MRLSLSLLPVVLGVLLLWLVAQGSEWYKNGDRAPRGDARKPLAETGT